MPWTPPPPLPPGYVVTSPDWTNYVVNNPIFLLSGRPLAQAYQNSGADYTLTVATTWTTIDTTNLALTLVTQSGRVRLEAYFALDGNLGAGVVGFDWLNNNSGSRSQAGNIGAAMWQQGAAVNIQPQIKVVAYFTGLTVATSYTFYLQYFKTSGTATMLRNSKPTLCIATEY